MTTRSRRQREPAVALGSSQRTWVADLMSYARDHAGVRVVGTVLSGREALQLRYDLLVVDDTTSYLTQRLVDRVRANQKLIVGVYDPDRGEFGRDKLMELGVDATIRADAPPREFLARIKAVAEQHLIDLEFAGLVAGEETRELITEEPGPEPSDDAPRGVVTVVSGSNGVTEVTVALATALAGMGGRVVAVDLDTLEPAVAQRLGLPVTPNVLTAIGRLRRGGPVGDIPVGPVGFAVLAGLPSPREWESCRPDDVTDLIGELAGGFDHIVVGVNRMLEDLSHFGTALGRFDVARRLVAAADELVVVGDPSPTGVTDVLAWVGDARALSGAPVHVLMNRAPRSLFQRGEIVQEIGRTFRSASVLFLPEDERVRKAGWQGETVPRGPFVAALRPLVATIATPAPVARGLR